MAGKSASRLESLERRVERLTTVLIIQSILLGIVVLISAFRSAPLLTLAAIVAIPLAVIYRRSLPDWLNPLLGLARKFLASNPATGPKRTRPDHAPAN